MKLGLEDYAYLESPIHRWDPRYKLVGLGSIIFGFAFVQDLRLLPPMFLLTLLIFWLSKIPFSYLFTRLRYPGVFLLTVAILLPLFSGQTVILSLGLLAVRLEGLLTMILVVTKFICILSLSVVLFGSAPFLTSIKAIQALGLPQLLADMTLLSYRYIFETGNDLIQMQIAMRLRGFQLKGYDRRSLNQMAAMAGTLLIRSYEQSERVYHAMSLRGYGHTPPSALAREFQAVPRDATATLMTGAIALAFFGIEILLRSGVGG
ncbi:MAG: cobalt ECF transporter T component CbiQ [Chloroflexota bacterium]